jgi:DNA-binding CsgD family transcriptional regulator
LADEIIGREAEIGSIRSFLESSARPAALVIHGEAGIGKTTVWKQGLATARQLSYRVLLSRPAETERRLSYSVLGDLLDEVLDESLPSLPEPQREALEVALLRRRAARSGPDHRAVSLATLGVLRALSGSAQVLLAVDDAQWTDPPSARVFQFVIRRLKAERLAILLSVRGTELDEDPFGLVDVLGEGRFNRLAVKGLSVEALGRILRGRLAVAFARPELVQLQKTSGGNPFYALEIARAMPRGERGAPGRLVPVPATLSDPVGDHLRALPAGTRSALLVASALSRPTTGLVRSALGGRMPKGALTRAANAGVIDLDGDEIRFSHPLFGSAMYSQTSPEERRRLHRRLAAIVQAPEERAWHLALSVDGPDGRVAAALDEAAARAHARGAPDAAAGLAEQAGRLTPATRPAEARRRLVEAADLHLEAGDTRRARTLLEEAAAGSRPGAERARALIRLAWTHAYQDGLPAAVHLFDQVLAEPGADLATRADAEHGLAWYYHAQDVPRAQEHARSAVEIARKLGDQHVLAEALAVEGFVDALSGRNVPIDALDRAVGHEERSGQTRPLASPAWILSLLLQWQGDQQGAKERLDRLHRDALERGDESSRQYILHLLARVECRLGHWQEALRLANEGYELTLQTGQVINLAHSLFSLALVNAHLGNVESSRAQAEEGLALATDDAATIDLSAAVGFLELSVGDPREAHRRLAPIVEALDAAGVREPAVFRAHPDEIEALIALGELDQAEALLGPFEERARARAHVWAMPVAGRCGGILLSARGDIEGALLRLERALRDHERLAEPFELARTVFAKGVVERRGKRKGDARKSLERALAVFDGLGAALWSERVKQELARIGGRAPAPFSLTPTEERVAALVSAGSSNRQVAGQLFISVNTVEANLKRIYRKLGITSRTQLSARVQRFHGDPP